MISLIKRNCTLDELLYPLSYYKSQDDIFFETADSVRAKRKIKRAYFEFQGLSDEPPPAIYYTHYDQSGRVEQSAMAVRELNDSILHKWKRDNSGRLKNYVTLNYEKGSNGKWKVQGDSVVIKYNPAGQPVEISRYSVTGAGSGRTSAFISKDVYAYNAGNNISSKQIDGYKYTYKYDANQRITRIECKASYDGEMYTIDSFAWKSGSYTDTMQHWAVSGYDHMRVLMDEQVINTITGQESSYTLHAENKYNFIRGLYGPIRTVYSYDAARRIVGKRITSTDGVLLSESGYSYAADGLSLGLQTLNQHDPANDLRALPPAALNFKGNLFVGAQINYVVQTPGQMPEAIEIKNTLVGIKGDTREVLAHGTETGHLRIVCEYYP